MITLANRQLQRKAAGGGGPATPVDWVISTGSTTIDLPAGLDDTLVAFFFDTTKDSTVTPTAVLPTGFTYINSHNYSTERHAVAYKILAPADSGTTLTGMDGDLGICKTLLIVQPDGSSVSTVTPSAVTYTNKPGPNASQTITSSSGSAPLLAVAFKAVRGGALTVTITESGGLFDQPADTFYQTNGSIASGLNYNLQTGTPADLTVTTVDDGQRNMLMSFYVEFA